MAFNISWDEVGEHYYETGVDRGVLYPYDESNEQTPYSPAVPWNGLTAVNESPSGAESNDLYADNIKYLSLRSAETFGATVEAYTYPDEFAECDGSAEIITGVTVSQQARKSFGLSYRTRKGSDTNEELGHIIHLVYGATASPSEKSRTTVNDSPEAVQFSWEMSTIPVEVEVTGATTEYRKTSHLQVDTTKLNETQITAIENALYGSGETPGYLPMPGEVYDIISGATGETGETGQTN